MTQSMVVVREVISPFLLRMPQEASACYRVFIQTRPKYGMSYGFDPKIKQPHSGECCYERGICIRCRDTFNEEQLKEEKSLEGQEYFALVTCSYELFMDPKRVAKHFNGNLGKAMGAFNRLSEAERKEWVDIAKQSILVEEAAAKAEERLPFWESKLEEKKMEANRRAVPRKRKASPMSSLDIEIAKWEKFCKGGEAMKKFAESKKDAEKGASSSNNAEK
ncbi:unnamed protein product [Trifolium pratense]|nr:unnamed protein product [Trifolium pratense]